MHKTRSIETKDSYFQLVREFPLRRLKNESEHAAAVAFLTRASLKAQDTKDGGVLDYLDMLAHLIDEYERTAALKVDTRHRTAAEVVRHLIDAGGLTVNRLARELGIGQSNLSEMLSGRREFSKSAIGKLCGRFGLNPQIFF